MRISFCNWTKFAGLFAVCITLQIASSLKIQAQTVSYQAPLTVPDPIDISLSRPIGTISGGMSVNSSGAATYSIPINIAPGTMGVEPNLSINYSSQGGNGQLGWGWSLSGLSAITRVGPNNYHDSRVAPIQWNNNDFYSLDGSRLIMASGNGGSGSLFNTEMESWAKIESMGWLGSGPEWFKVWMKDGTVREYGHEPLSWQPNNSKLLNNAGTEVLSWKINRITDVHGNFMSFHYTDNGGEHRIAGIWYTGSTTLDKLPYQQVDFKYAERQDPNTVYEGGDVYQSKYLLTDVLCYSYVNSTRAVRNSYSLKYKYIDNYSFLQSVEHCPTGGSCLNKTQFIYGELNTAISYHDLTTDLVYQGTGDNNGAVTHAGDFNGDGLSDVVQYEKNDEDHILVLTDLVVKRNNGTNGVGTPTFTQIYTYPLQSAFYGNTVSSPSNYNFHYSDYDGDGTDDILLEERNNDILTKIIIISKLQSNTPVVTPYPPPANHNTVENAHMASISGDFDGDGRVDFITCLKSTAPGNNGFELFMTSPGKGYTNEKILFPTGSLQSSISPGRYVMHANMTVPIDFDGDGKNELLFIDNDMGGVSKTNVCGFERVLSNSGLFIWDAKMKYQQPYPTCWHSVLLGDFNGDRKTDLLTRANDGTNKWEMAFSDGSYFRTEDLSFNFNPKYRTEDHNWKLIPGDDRILLSDFDGDGKTDIIQAFNVPNTSNTSTFNQHYSRGKNTWLNMNPSNSGFIHYSNIVADFNGDGKADILTMSSDYHLFSFRETSKDKLLSTIRNGLGRTNSISYKNLTCKACDLYTWSQNTDYPLNNIRVPYMVVEGTSTGSLGFISNVERKKYKYENLRLHRGGKGILGFEKTSVIDPDAKIKTSSIISNWHPTVYIPQTTKSEVYQYFDQWNQNLLSTTTNDYIVTPLANLRYKYQLDFTKSDDLLQGTYSAKRFWYDANGNSYKTATEVNGWQEENIIETSYANSFSTRTPVPALPENIKITYIRSGAPPASVETNYLYQNGGLIKKTDFFGQPNSIVHQYNVNPVGLTTATYTTAGGQTRVSYVGYDPLWRAATSATNSLGETSTTTYDYRWGVPLTTTSIDNLTTTYTYDAFGVLRSTLVPDGYTINRNFKWGNTGDARYLQTLTNPAEGITEVTFDDRTRETQARKSMWGAGNSILWSTSSKTYHYATGQIWSETAPRFSNEPLFTTTYTYDNLNRLERIENPIGVTRYGYTYNGGTLKVETEDPAGHKSSKVTDAAGKVIRSTTEGGTVQFEYDSWGNIIRTFVGTGSIYATQAQYDDYNRRTSYSESSAGSTVYSYNDFGELQSETDAAGNLTTTSYDDLGRVIERIGGEGTTTYEYWGAGNTGATGKLKTAIGFTPGSQTDYSYDNFGYLANITETQNGQLYTTHYGYDLFGRPDMTVYPNGGPIVTNAYNNHGLLTDVLCNNINLYSVQEINGQGQTLAAVRGDGKWTVKTYQYGAPLSFYTPGVQDYRLTYDWPRRLVTSRQDNALNTYIVENFQYDAADRLESSTLINPFAAVPQPQVITYGTGGGADNIAEKSDIGQFKYQSARPHAMGYTNNTANQISQQTQDIDYTPFHRPEKITEDGWELIFQYGSDYERRQTDLRYNGALQETRLYFGSGSERHLDATNGTVRDLFYIPGPDGVAAIYKIENGQPSFMYPYADHLGTITAVTNAGGDVACRQAFDPWGRRRNPYNWEINDNALPSGYSWLRGFTGHEQLPQFKLINMNARLYDPLLGRMLSPDVFVTNVGDPKAYNLYSYANNNPIAYIDPSGNFLAPLFAGVAFLGEFASNLVYGVSDPIGTAFNTAISATKEVGTAFQYTVSKNSNSSFTLGIDPFNIGLTANYARVDGDGSVTSNIGIGINVFGLSANAGVNFNTGNWNWGGSFGTNFHTYSVGFGAEFNDGHTSLGYYQTYFGGKSKDNFGGEDGKQWSGGVKAGSGDFSFRYENDFFIKKGPHKKQDRWRTHAIEFGIGDITFGSHVITNDPGNMDPRPDPVAEDSPIWGPNSNPKYGSWGTYGKVFSAPAYIGIRYGNMVSRAGYGAPAIQDFQQNGFHTNGLFRPGNQNYYLNYSNFRKGPYGYGGFYNQHSLYGF